METYINSYVFIAARLFTTIIRRCGTFNKTRVTIRIAYKYLIQRAIKLQNIRNICQ